MTSYWRSLASSLAKAEANWGPRSDIRESLGNTTGTGNPHGSHDGYRAGTGTGTFLLTRAHTRTRGTGLHTRRSFPPSTRNNDDATTMAPRSRPVLTAHPHMRRRQRDDNASPIPRPHPPGPLPPSLTCDDNDATTTTAPRPHPPLSHVTTTTRTTTMTDDDDDTPLSPSLPLFLSPSPSLSLPLPRPLPSCDNDVATCPDDVTMTMT